jgi:integrase
MASDGRADCHHDRRFYALVLLATFASLRLGEATALRRCDLDLTAATVRVRASYVERSTGEMLIGPPKSKAGRRIVGIPPVIVPVPTSAWPSSPRTSPAHWSSQAPRAARRGGATSTRCQPGRTRPSRLA